MKQLDQKKSYFQKILIFTTQHIHYVFLGCAFWFFLEYVILGPFSYVRVGDNMDSFVPRLVSMWSSFREFGLTYWHPSLAGGVDRLANEIPQFHIVSVLFYLLPGWLALGVVLIGSTFLGGWYTFRLCRESLQLSLSSSVCAGILFQVSLSRYDIIFFITGLAALPCVIYFLEYQNKVNAIKKILLYSALIGIGFSFFTSLIFTLPFTLGAIFLWFVVVKKQYTPKAIIAVVVCTVFSFTFHIQQCISLIVNGPLSQRGGGDYYQATLRHYIIVVQEVFLQNWLALTILLVGVISLRMRNRQLVRVILLVIGLVIVAPWYQYIATHYGSYFSLVRNFSLDRFYLLTPFFASIGVALVLTHVTSYIALGDYVFLEYKKYSLRTFLVIMIFIVIGYDTLLIKLSHGNLWITQGSYWAYAHSPDLKKLNDATSQNPPFRVATIGSDSRIELFPTLAHFHRLETIDGHANLTSRRFIDYFRILSKRQNVKSDMYFFWHPTEKELEDFKIDSTLFLNVPLLSLSNTQFLISRIPINIPGLVLREDLSSNELLKKDFTSTALNRLRENFSGRSLLIYENKEVLPRFFLTKSVKFFENKTALLSALEKTTSTSFIKDNVFLNVEDIATTTLPRLFGTLADVHLDYYSPDRIELSTQSDGPVILVVTNNYNPFWKVTVNGVVKKPFPAYHTFTGVILEEKTSKVVLEYVPPYILKF